MSDNTLVRHRADVEKISTFLRFLMVHFDTGQSVHPESPTPQDKSMAEACRAAFLAATRLQNRGVSYARDRFRMIAPWGRGGS